MTCSLLHTVTCLQNEEPPENSLAQLWHLRRLRRPLLIRSPRPNCCFFWPISHADKEIKQINIHTSNNWWFSIAWRLVTSKTNKWINVCNNLPTWTITSYCSYLFKKNLNNYNKTNERTAQLDFLSKPSWLPSALLWVVHNLISLVFVRSCLEMCL